MLAILSDLQKMRLHPILPFDQHLWVREEEKGVGDTAEGINHPAPASAFFESVPLVQS